MSGFRTGNRFPGRSRRKAPEGERAGRREGSCSRPPAVAAAPAFAGPPRPGLRRLAAVLVLALLPAGASASELSLSMTGRLKGTGMLRTTLDLSLSPGEYRIRVGGKTTGLYNLLLGLRFSAGTEGKIAGGRLIPGDYVSTSSGRFRGRHDTVLSREADDRPPRVSLVPAPVDGEDPAPASPEGMTGIPDMLSALLGAFLDDGDGVCSGATDIFDGRRHYRFTFRKAGVAPEQRGAGDRLAFPVRELFACHVDLLRLAGYSRSRLEEPEQQDLAVFLLARAGPLPVVLPLAVAVETSFGKVRMEATGIHLDGRELLLR